MPVGIFNLLLQWEVDSWFNVKHWHCMKSSITELNENIRIVIAVKETTDIISTSEISLPIFPTVYDELTLWSDLKRSPNPPDF